MTPEQLQRLAGQGFEAFPLGHSGRHICFARDPFAALVEVGEISCRVGAAGRITPQGIAVLMWREGAAWFTAKGYQQAASEEDVELLRKFQSDLEQSLLDRA
ncbi:MAG: hypothetical protein R2762_15105 [Bryobacteraceae bacterium]